MESVSTTAGTANASVGEATREALKDAIVVDTQQVRSHLDEVVRSTVEQTLNQLLDEEADRVAGAGKYERSADRRDTHRRNARPPRVPNILNSAR
ncbi:MAG: transposase [Phycisphaerae bacterium]|nr:transposase [Phycisphaerae bacterium]